MSGAILSDCGTYRYLLTRSAFKWQRAVKPCLFVMLNPSTADASQDDPTIRRCMSFAVRENCSSLTVVNLFAYRATDPKQLALCKDPVGPDNEMHCTNQLEQHKRGLIIAAWGAHKLKEEFPFVEWFKCALANAGVVCLGENKDGSPKHPLYVAKSAPLVEWA
jgi:hypothetical protein